MGLESAHAPSPCPHLHVSLGRSHKVGAPPHLRLSPAPLLTLAGGCALQAPSIHARMQAVAAAIDKKRAKSNQIALSNELVLLRYYLQYDLIMIAECLQCNC